MGRKTAGGLSAIRGPLPIRVRLRAHCGSGKEKRGDCERARWRSSRWLCIDPPERSAVVVRGQLFSSISPSLLWLPGPAQSHLPASNDPSVVETRRDRLSPTCDKESKITHNCRPGVSTRSFVTNHQSPLVSVYIGLDQDRQYLPKAEFTPARFLLPPRALTSVKAQTHQNRFSRAFLLPPRPSLPQPAARS